MRRGVTAVFLTILMAAAVVLTGPAAQAAPGKPPTGQSFPPLIVLPNGFAPEGISTGRGSSFYVGSLADGAIYRGDLRTGAGAVLVSGEAGRVAVGNEVDSRNRLFVAGGPTGFGRVYDARTGKLLKEYAFTAPGTGFVNDVVVTRDAAYFTDSNNPVLYVVPFGRGGKLGEMTTLPLTGALEYAEGFNVNGIEASPDGRTLLVVQSNKGLLFSVSARTGEARQVDLGGYVLTNGDGLLRRGSTLYVVQNRLNQIAAFTLDRGYRSGTLTGTITDPDFQVPTTVAAFGSSLYAVNARFGTPPTPDTTYAVVRVAAC
jgi:sugar lactone lactonase YvrE